jgi:hypothetical protein
MFDLTSVNTYADSDWDHGGIDGLGDDDHSQYLLLAGRAGGQKIYGLDSDGALSIHVSNTPLTTWINFESDFDSDGWNYGTLRTRASGIELAMRTGYVFEISGGPLIVPNIYGSEDSDIGLNIYATSDSDYDSDARIQMWNRVVVADGVGLSDSDIPAATTLLVQSPGTAVTTAQLAISTRDDFILIPPPGGGLSIINPTASGIVGIALGDTSDADYSNWLVNPASAQAYLTSAGAMIVYGTTSATFQAVTGQNLVQGTNVRINAAGVGTGYLQFDVANDTDNYIVFNQLGYPIDYIRMESDSDANAFYLDGLTGNIGLGTASPFEKLHVQGKVYINTVGGGPFATPLTGADDLVVEGGDTDNVGISVLSRGATAALYFGDSDLSSKFSLIYNFDNRNVQMGAEGFLYFMMDTDGVVFNDTGFADFDYRIESDTDDYMFFIQGSTSRLGIGASAPAGKLHIWTAAAAATPHANADELVVTGANPGISVLASAAGVASIYLSQSSDNDAGYIDFGTITNTMRIGALSTLITLRPTYMQFSGNGSIRAQVDSDNLYAIGPLRLGEITEPATPPAGSARLYADSDREAKWKGSDSDVVNLVTRYVAQLASGYDTNLLDTNTRYFGVGGTIDNRPQTSNDGHPFIFSRPGTIQEVVLSWWLVAGGTQGSSDNVACYLWLNDTDQISIGNIQPNLAIAGGIPATVTATLDQDVVAGDYIYVELDMPASWGTPPQYGSWACMVTIRDGP